MASSDRPIPLPPRTPTPPPEDNLDGFSNSPTKSVYDPTALSPMDENFSPARTGPIPTFATTNLALAETDTNSIYSPMSMDSNESGNINSSRKMNSLMVEDTNGVFNFQPATMAKAPVSAKSVCQSAFRSYCPYTRLTEAFIGRLWDNDAATNTNTAAYPISSSSNLLLAPLYPSPILSPFPLSKNAAAACRASRTTAYTGPSATWP